MYDCFYEKLERRKNLKLLELLETENKAELPFISSPCSQSYADEIKAKSIFFDEHRNLNNIPGPNEMHKCIDKGNFFNVETSIEYLGLAKNEVSETNKPILSRNRFRKAIIDIGETHYRSKIKNFARYPASRLGKIFRAKSTKEILLDCDGYTTGNPPILYLDRSDENFTSN